MSQITIKYLGRSNGQKKRRYLHRFKRKIMAEVESSRLDLSFNNWYNLWHHHLDWNGLGQESIKWRSFFSEQYYRLMAQYSEMSLNSELKMQIWLMFDLNDAGQDAVFVHSKNPHTDFPAKYNIDTLLSPKEIPIELLGKNPMQYAITKDRSAIICQSLQQAESINSILT